ncbi:MAG: carbamoyl-phosphate synthase large subunit, partial [Spirochaetales bacterium]|nr:carbamoyl-phosphate synthase large subunit [Candidatus Physcosoma equi]
MKRTDIHHILVVGSGPIVIGQGCEFDYSGCQAVRALKEEGYEVSLVNPNPATVMTSPGLADHTYLEPLKEEYIIKIFEQAAPDAILSTMGGQTALNLVMQLKKDGILDAYGVKVIGADTDSIDKAEDREKFKKIIESLGLEQARSGIARSLEDAYQIHKTIQLPIIIRPSFTLGGMGGSIVEKEEDFERLVTDALEISPVHEVLLEESLIGWREFEMEVMRDSKDNAIIVCSIENVDPMGVHTGDSITVAPIQTLSDEEYQKMRTASIDILRAVGVDCGGSNVQFAVSPDHKRMVVIEMNPRVSRSSALASKATGFPIARISAKLAVGYTLDEVQNEITGASVSCFEPALDYCAVKVPRFELEKFPLASSTLGTQMRSVGETLALGRTMLEAMNKAFRSSEQKLEGISVLDRKRYDVETLLHSAHPLRYLALYTVIKEGRRDLETLSKETGFDVYFLHLLVEMTELEGRLEKEELTEDLYLDAKKNGLSDKKIKALTGKKDLPYSLTPVRHFVDTCAGEFEALTPYLYNTYGEEDQGMGLGENSVVILASGPNRIGQGLEFDTCCTLSSKAFRRHGIKTIMVNSNPETVSTDYNTSDRLYIEPLNAESVLNIMKNEGTKNV